MKLIIIKLLVVVILSMNGIKAQSFIGAHTNFNYWQHSEVFGPGIGIGFSYKINKIVLTLDYEFGYGSINRSNKFKNINYDYWSTVFIKTEEGKWKEYLGFTGNEATDLKGSLNYGKQNQASVKIGYTIKKLQNSKFLFNIGLYGALVEQFYTFKNILINRIELPLTYSGPLNYIPSTSQKILTYGINFEFLYLRRWNTKDWGPFINYGFGPNYGSYLGLGLKLNTILKKK